MSDRARRNQRGGLSPAIIEAMRNTGMDPEILGCIQDAQEVLAFDVPEPDLPSFRVFHDFITNPQPRFITEWRASPRDEKWYIALVEGVNGATRNAYACVAYHLQRLSDLETDVMERISKRNYAPALANNSTIALGNTLIWDFEYQAFVFAYRRCLDYLTLGFAAFFKHDFDSFNKLPKSLRNKKPQNVADALAEVHKKHCANFDFVMSAGGRKSVRDRIAHREWVSAGVINLSSRGFILAGGGEALPFKREYNTASLAEALALRVQMLKACIDEMLTVFVTEAKAWEATRTPDVR
jgi:hypothetical protein